MVYVKIKEIGNVSKRFTNQFYIVHDKKTVEISQLLDDTKSLSVSITWVDFQNMFSIGRTFLACYRNLPFLCVQFIRLSTVHFRP